MIPEAVVVAVNGGRIRTRTSGSAPGVHEAQNREDKIACLATMTGPTFATDPCPEPPQSFLCPGRVQRLVRQVKGSAGRDDAQEIPGESVPAGAESVEVGSPDRWSPAKLVRTCVASVKASSSFRPLVAADARQRHFHQARRRAFVADAAGYNCSTHASYFDDV